MKLKAVLKSFSVLMSLSVLLSLFPVNVHAAETITSNKTGTHEGFYYSFWNQGGGGSVVMTLGSGGNYSVNWSNCTNFTCGKGWEKGSANKVVNFSGSFNGGSNGYLALYGWTKDPLIEYYIIENYGAWTPPGGTSIGQMTSDGGTYKIYKMRRTNAPSIIGTASFDQFFSVRTTKRSSGTITFANHVSAWKSKGLNLGTTWDYLIMESEGYQSSGSANITVSDGGNPNPTNSVQPTATLLPVTERSAFSTIEAEEYNAINGTEAKSFGTGVGYINNGDSIVYKKINFGSGAKSFTAKVANGGTTTTTMQLRLGSQNGTLIGSLDIAPTGAWETYQDLTANVSGASSTQDLYLCFNGSTNIDSFSFTQSGGQNNTLLLGDVDENGSVNSLDFAKYRLYLLGQISYLPNTGDIDRNNSMNSIDFAMLRQHILGLIDLGKTTIATPTKAPIPTPTKTAAPIPKTTIKIMPLGDSITYGVNVSGGYRTKLWKNITSNGFNVDFVGSMTAGPSDLADKNNEGHSGWRIDQVSNSINSWMDTYKPQIVLLHIGTNDLNQSYDLGNASNRLSGLVDKICAKLPTGGKLYVASIIPISYIDVSSYNSQLATVVKNKANQGKPVYLVDMYSAVSKSDLADTCHPNANGYNKMGDVWFNAIKADLAK